MLAEPGSTPEPLGLSHLRRGLLDAIVQRPPSVRAMGEQEAHPSLTTQAWCDGEGGIAVPPSSTATGVGFSRASLPAGCCDCQRSQKPRVPFPFLGR